MQQDQYGSDAVHRYNAPSTISKQLRYGPTTTIMLVVMRVSDLADRRYGEVRKFAP